MAEYENRGCNDSSWWENLNIALKVLVVIGGIVVAAGFLFLFGFIVMHLWNWLMPDLFHLKTVTYWQAWGLTLLSCILFKGWGPSGGNRGGKKIREQVRKEVRSEIRRAMEEKGSI